VTVTGEDTRRLDGIDPLSHLSGVFDTHGAIHLNGNSLGPPRDALTAELDRVVSDEWATHQVGAWFENGWLELPRRTGDKIATLLGAAPGQVVVPGDTTSATLFNALVAACRLREDRPVLLVEAEAFPTDRYVAASVARLLGRELVAEPRAGFDRRLREHGGDVAAALTAPVDFRTAERREIGPTTELCHAAGAVSVWDLSHAAGVLPVELDAHGVDLAVGCGYKYLGGGPGAPAFLYVACALQDDVDLPLTGWHGHASPFDMAADFEPATGIDRGRTGTPPILSIVALDHAVAPLVAMGIDWLHERSAALGEIFLDSLREWSPALLRELASPRDAGRRGAHVALRVPLAAEVERVLAERGVLVDSRSDLVRVAFAPLYVTPEQVHDAAGELAGAIHEVEAGR
jgi:kynureninase